MTGQPAREVPAGTDLGSWIGEPHWGHVYMSEAAEALVALRASLRLPWHPTPRIVASDRQPISYLADLLRARTRSVNLCQI